MKKFNGGDRCGLYGVMVLACGLIAFAPNGAKLVCLIGVAMMIAGIIDAAIDRANS